ncbi:NAD(P)-binding domain-containing protein, partial [Streptacidiphilus sp. ASG 303]|nr:NAD(P)-binding domain-containing protein [Streptacidiphilus sp. ASG 303]
AFARTEDKVARAARTMGGGARPGSPEQAARHGGVVLLSTPWPVTLGLVDQVADSLTGRVVWDTTNPFAPDLSELVLGTTTSAGEEVARHAPDAAVVKAIPPFA